MPQMIPVDRVEQQGDHLCGPAVAVMILSALGVQRPPRRRTKRGWQQDLWEDVKRLTTGPKRPRAMKKAEGLVPDFKGQQCFFCGGESICWATTPQALRAVLNEHLPPKWRQKIARTRLVNEHLTTLTVLRSVDAGSPVALASGAASHWVVVHGYVADDPNLEPTPVGEFNLNGLYMKDPLPGAGDGLDMVTPRAWEDEYVTLVKCGAGVDRDKHVAIVKKGVKEQ